MTKALSEMTLEELWQLFPIRLVPHRDAWATQYERMSGAIAAVLPDCAPYRISHIGSTSVNGIWAKDIVDILLEVKDGLTVEDAASRVGQLGFVPMWTDDSHISLNLGYTPNGFAEEVFHLHIRRFGDNDELYFRDYLNDHPCDAAAYEQLKLGLWKRFEHNRDAYTEAKTGFIKECTDKARKLYGDRYM